MFGDAQVHGLALVICTIGTNRLYTFGDAT